MDHDLTTGGRDPGTAAESAAATEVDPAAAATLDRATRQLARVPVDAPAGLVDSVMRTVSAELRPTRRIALGSAAGGTSFVTETAVGSALRMVLDDDPSVIARRVRVDQLVRGAEGSVRVWMSVAVSYEHFSVHGEELVRRRVVDAVRTLFDLHAVEVDLDVVDVFTERPTGPVTR